MNKGSESSVNEFLEEAYKRLLPAFGYLISAQAGFIASVIVLATWLIKKGSSRYGHISIEEDSKAIARLLKDIDRLEAEVSALRKALKRSKSRSVTESVLRSKESVLESLYEELELRQLRIEALRRLESIGDKKLIKEVMELVKRIEEGKEFEEKQLKIFKKFEDLWRKRQIEINTLRSILGG